MLARSVRRSAAKYRSRSKWLTLREALVEGHDQQECEQHLDARQRDAQLAHQLDQVAVVAFELSFVAVHGANDAASFRPVQAPIRGFVLHRWRFVGGSRRACAPHQDCPKRNHPLLISGFASSDGWWRKSRRYAASR